MTRLALFFGVLAAALCSAPVAWAEGSIDYGASMKKAVESSLTGTAQAGGDFAGLVDNPFMKNIQNGTITDASGTVIKRLSKQTKNAIKPVQSAITTAGSSFVFKALPALTLTSDSLPAVVAPLLEGDKIGATAGAVGVMGGTAAGYGGAALGGAIGTAGGAFFGSSVPVVGTAVGGVVGGAVGRIAGGFIAATSYELFAKDSVVRAVETGIISMFDPRPSHIRAREDFLRAQAAADMKPIWDRYYQVSEGFGLDSVSLMATPTILYQQDVPPTQTQTPPSAPPTEMLVSTLTFDAMPVSGSWETSDGSTGTWNAEEIAIEDQPEECRFLAIRDGLFFQKCPSEAMYPFDGGNVRIEGNQYFVGQVHGNQIAGESIYWSRNFYTGWSDRDNGEYMRSVTRGPIVGSIDANGMMHLETSVELDQVFDRPTKFIDTYIAFTSDDFIPRDMQENGTAIRITTVYKISGVDVDGTLKLPQITAEDIRALMAGGIDLPAVFFQHGVSAPDLESFQ